MVKKTNVKKILLACLILTTLISSIYIISPVLKLNESTNVSPEEFSASSSFYCKDTYLFLNCNFLSKVNKHGTQTRCYVYSELLSYKICKSGWVKK